MLTKDMNLAKVSIMNMGFPLTQHLRHGILPYHRHQSAQSIPYITEFSTPSAKAPTPAGKAYDSSSYALTPRAICTNVSPSSNAKVDLHCLLSESFFFSKKRRRLVYTHHDKISVFISFFPPTQASLSYVLRPSIVRKSMVKDVLLLPLSKQWPFLRWSCVHLPD